MQITRIKNRGFLFTYSKPGWDFNIYLILGRKYNYIIDTGLGSLSMDPILEFIKADNKKLIVINTHHHWDHVWGNATLKDSIIVSHKLCREMIDSKWQEMMQRNSQYCEGVVEKSLPGLIFDKELYFAEDKIKLFHSPGHTSDSISVLDEEDNVLCVGDNVGDSMDDIIPSLYCEKDVYIDTLQKYQELNFDNCISGHNIIQQKDVIANIIDILRKQKA